MENNIKIKGSWINSCKSYYVQDNNLYAYLRTIDNNYNLDYINNIDKISENKTYENINGCFRSLINNKFQKNIFQTHKSIEYINSKQKVLDAMYSWMKYSYKFNYKFYTNEMCHEFIKNNFSGNIYNAYMKLPENVPVMRADLWRYCIIYKYGGIYADSDTMCLVDPDILLNDDALLVCTPENNVHLCQWIFSAPANSPILKSIIDLSVERILEIKEIKGEHIIHHLTGPGVFTDGVEKYLKDNNLITYDDRRKYIKYINPVLDVFNDNFFHNHVVKHLFTGRDNDGWGNDRDKFLI
jgi:mannosyltransferase OCH1-like enzyme